MRLVLFKMVLRQTSESHILLESRVSEYQVIEKIVKEIFILFRNCIGSSTY